jgi:hypothetical protein
VTRGIYVKVRTTKVKGTSKAILGSVSAGPRFKDALARKSTATSGARSAIEKPVCTENLNTGVVVMKSAQDGK